MKKWYIATGMIFLISGIFYSFSKGESTLKEALKGKFYIGVALNENQIKGRDTTAIRIIKQHFNSIVAENCMKSMYLQPKEGVFDFSLSDQFVQFGLENNMYIIGHTLIWHAQAPEWLFKDEKGNEVSKEVLIQRMRNHIYTVVKHYKGKVKGWDVVNEAIDDNTGDYRKNKFYQIIGEEYIPLAFQFAHEADPEAELYYNDYSLTNPKKRLGAIKLIKTLQNRGLRIDAVGEQGHYGLEFPTLEEVEQTIKDFSALGIKVMITELDVSVLPMDWSLGANVEARMKYKEKTDIYKHELPDSVYQQLHQRYLNLFKLFIKYSPVISRVTLWGLTDADSWKNDWPIFGRTDYPLLFDRKYQPKPIVYEIIKEANR